MGRRLPGWLRTLATACWVLLLAGLPLTSFPWLIRLVNSDLVGSPAAVGMALLAVLWLPVYLLRRGRVPRVTLPILGFFLAALIATAAGGLIPIPPFKEIPLLERAVRGLFTLAAGLGFYLIAATFPQNPSRLRLSLQVLNLTGAVLLAWSLLQAYYWFRLGDYPVWLEALQLKLSVHGLYDRRVSGMAFEPSWLAHQLNTLYLPVWLGCSVARTSAFRPRLLGLTAENLLLLGGIAVLLASFSRVGWLAFLLMVAFLALLANLALARGLNHRLLARLRLPISPPLQQALLSAVLLLAFAVVYIGAGLGLARVGSRVDPRLERLFWERSAPLFSLETANQLAFAERVVYWAEGWEVFGEYPVLGVGLNNAGYFFQEKLPAFGWALPEVNMILYRVDHIPNTKALWSRMVAETGVVGLALFLAWLAVLWTAARALRHHRLPLARALGWMGAFVIVGLLIEGFSVDSFALPYWWISLGLLSAASEVYLRQPALPLEVTA